METLPILRREPTPTRLEIDLVGDFACPWSFLGMRRLNRALGKLSGVEVGALRWHPFRLLRDHKDAAPSWREHLATRLPAGVDVRLAESSLAAAGLELGIRFDFDRLARMPETTHAHRLAKLATRELKQAFVLDAIFRAWFEEVRDIADVDELVRIGSACGLSAGLLEEFRDPKSGYDEVVNDEQRLLTLGVNAIPNLLFNGYVLVPGPADEHVYVKALDQALFPQPAEGERAPTKH